MNTRLLMIVSAATMGVVGLAATFAPVEVLAAAKIAATDPLPVVVQLLGALYIGFAMANWIAKDNAIGGIYSRPLSIANFVHFVSGALALLKYEYAHGFAILMLIPLVVYAVFAIAFSYLVFGMGATRVVAPNAK
jgi:hypothetical protein